MLSLLFSPIREFFKKGDLILLFLCLSSSTFVLALIYSATQYLGETRWIRFILVQFIAIVLGVVAYILLTFVEPNFRKYAFPQCREAKFVLAKLGNDAGIYGAAALILRNNG